MLKKLFLFINISVLLCTVVKAEEYIIEGYPFEVDSVREVSGSLYEVTIAHVSRIVEKPEDYILDYYLKNANLFEQVNVKNLFKHAITEGHIERAVIILNAWLLQQNFGEQDIVKVIDALNVEDIGFYQQALGVLDQDKYPNVNAYLVLKHLVKLDNKSLANTLILDTQKKLQSDRFTQAFMYYLTAAYLKAFSDENFKNVNVLLDVEKKLLSETNEHYQKFFRIQRLIGNVLAPNNIGLIKDLSYLNEVIKNDRKILAVLSPLVVKQYLVLVKKEFFKHNYQKALFYLSKVDLNFKSEELIQLVSQIFTEMIDKDIAVVFDDATLNFLRSISGQNANITLVLLQYFEKQFYKYIKQSKLAEANAVFDFIVFIRLDPNKANDALRVSQVVSFAWNDHMELALQKKQEIQTGISFWSHIQFLFSGIYISLYTIISTFAGLCLICLVFKFYSWCCSRKNNKDEKVEDSYASGSTVSFECDDETRNLIRERLAKMRFSSNPRMQEYEKYITELGLKVDASLNTVKSRYRLLVKKLHPDLNKNVSREDAEKFARITECYEKVLALRKELSIDL